jgi:dTDP-glucose 4,6-dehydratase
VREGGASAGWAKCEILFKPLPQDDPKKLLGWEPKVELREGLGMSVEYFKEQVSRE